MLRLGTTPRSDGRIFTETQIPHALTALGQNFVRQNYHVFTMICLEIDYRCMVPNLRTKKWHTQQVYK